jgi:hypothetical protein
MLVDPDGMICQDSLKSHAGNDHADGLTTLQWIPAPEHWRIGLVESIEMQVVVNGACAVEVPPEKGGCNIRNSRWQVQMFCDGA